MIRLVVFGQPQPQGLPPTMRDKIVVQGNGCWMWTAAIGSQGYAAWWDGERTRMAHRVAYESLVGPIPERDAEGNHMVLDHLCRHRPCVNPEHLEVVTNRENIVRGTGWAARNAAKTHCPEGHPYSGDNLKRDGHARKCRACIRERERAPERTECRNGHPHEGNRYRAANGEARCRACNREKRRRQRAREVVAT